MIRRLRTGHRRAFVGIALFVSLLFVLALAARPERPPLHAPSAEDRP